MVLDHLLNRRNLETIDYVECLLTLSEALDFTKGLNIMQSALALLIPAFLAAKKLSTIRVVWLPMNFVAGDLSFLVQASRRVTYGSMLRPIYRRMYYHWRSLLKKSPYSACCCVSILHIHGRGRSFDRVAESLDTPYERSLHRQYFNPGSLTVISIKEIV
ncbi:hypothetical protein N7532_005460 [Penicillium argentinense]|uniref:Uncharacterized protein n=1 Tax=Penicillium argentinense TaxID=1131581 RepID=A0A9W9K9V8_9EURO|nr:uncharacterized protein N7532_005460 [Penicillium argentinense]KAJ5098459.1 hypothetical protein N7532_005460 [Penicillium argentinense]